MTSLLIGALALVGSFTVYYYAFKVISNFLDWMNDFKYKIERQSQKTRDKIAVKKFLKEEKERELQEAILRMKAEKLKKEKMLSDLANDLENDDTKEEYKTF
ncbi:hypothetical protein phi9181_ORF059 [Enterococcus phage 9181]|nr:hypothetical protein phi9181_ORF059 [Enterococcus phage 9181]